MYAWGRSSSSFDITAIDVAGTHLVPEKRALRLLRQEYAGRNLFTVTGGDVRRTLAPLSFVRGARIDRDFPETLAVTLTEYEPAAYALAGGRWYVVDRDGYVICTAAEAADQLARKPAKKASPEASATPGPADAADAEPPSPPPRRIPRRRPPATTRGRPAPSLSGCSPAPERPRCSLPRIAVSGRVREGSVVTDKAAAEMLSVIAALPRSLQRSLAAVQNDDGQITLRFVGGPVTTWGDAERTLAKTVALRTVLKEYARAGKTCTLLDVSIPDRTLARPVLQ